MNFLDKLTPDHRQLFVRLPYRVGFWVSRSDRTGGGESQEQERQALSAILHGFAEDVFGAETIQVIISETIRQKDQWNSWGREIDLVTSECATAIDLMREYGEDKDVKAFRTQMMEIADAVAVAFREEKRVSVFALCGKYISFVFSGSSRSRKVQTFRDFVNISAQERKALKAIAVALEAA